MGDSADARAPVFAADEAIRREGSMIEVRELGGCKGVFAREDIPTNSSIKLRGVVSQHPTRYSIQLDEYRHLNVPADEVSIDNPDFFWRYLNHHCRPNGHINTAELTFHALRKIGKGEECTFNYLTTEFEMAVPFTCLCGDVKCFGLIRGYKYLSEGQREELAVLAATPLTS